MKWSNLEILIRALGEKSHYIYLYGGMVIYIVWSFLKTFEQNGWDFSLMLLTDQTKLPVFLVIGFIQAFAYFLGRHLYHATVPEELKNFKSEEELRRQLAAKRQLVIEEYKSYIDDIKKLYKLHASAQLEVLAEELSEKKIDRMATDLVSTFKTDSHFDVPLQRSVEDVSTFTTEGINASRKPCRWWCTSLLIISLFAWVAHTVKLIFWSLSVI